MPKMKASLPDERPKPRYKFKPVRLKLAGGADAPRPLSVASLHDQLVARLREMVVEGELAPGSPLPEMMLCETFGVSRTPLREAFKVLAGEGLISLRPHRTPVVMPVDTAELAALFDVARVLEEHAAGLACARASELERAELFTLHGELGALHRAEDRRGYTRTNQAIHAAIVRMSGNAVLVNTLAGLTVKIRRARAQVNQYGGRWAESYAEHEAFMALFGKGDSAGFAAAIAEHTRRTEVAVMAALAQSLADKDPA